jgi:hypothetical protein
VPATLIASLTSRGFGVAATYETDSGTASGRTFLRNVLTNPFHQIGWKLQTILVHFLLSVVGVLHDHAAAAAVDRHVERLWEHGTFLDQAIADQAEVRLLRVDHGFVVRRAVAEAKEQPRRHAIAAHVLDQVAVGECLPVQGFQREESMDQALRMTDWQGLAGLGGGLPE